MCAVNEGNGAGKQRVEAMQEVVGGDVMYMSHPVLHEDSTPMSRPRQAQQATGGRACAHAMTLVERWGGAALLRLSEAICRGRFDAALTDLGGVAGRARVFRCRGGYNLLGMSARWGSKVPGYELISALRV